MLVIDRYYNVIVSLMLKAIIFITYSQLALSRNANVAFKRPYLIDSYYKMANVCIIKILTPPRLVRTPA